MNSDELNRNHALQVLTRCGAWAVFSLILIPSLFMVTMIWFSRPLGGSSNHDDVPQHTSHEIMPGERLASAGQYDAITPGGSPESLPGSAEKAGFWVFDSKVNLLIGSFFWGVLGGSIGVLRLAIWARISNIEIVLTPIIGGLIGVLVLGLCIVVISILTMGPKFPVAEAVYFLCLVSGAFPKYTLDRLEKRFGHGG